MKKKTTSANEIFQDDETTLFVCVFSTCKMSDILAEAVKGAGAHPRPECIQFAYGTAGFRDK